MVHNNVTMNEYTPVSSIYWWAPATGRVSGPTYRPAWKTHDVACRSVHWLTGWLAGTCCITEKSGPKIGGGLEMELEMKLGKKRRRGEERMARWIHTAASGPRNTCPSKPSRGTRESGVFASVFCFLSRLVGPTRHGTRMRCILSRSVPKTKPQIRYLDGTMPKPMLRPGPDGNNIAHHHDMAWRSAGVSPGHTLPQHYLPP